MESTSTSTASSTTQTPSPALSPTNTVDVAALTSNIEEIRKKIKQAWEKSEPSKRSVAPPRLVAVSKTKPSEAITAIFEAGQRDFGENYVQELCEKARSLEGKLQGIRWHFIGHLQSNKVRNLIRGTPNLAVIETVDSLKLAQIINREWTTSIGHNENTPLDIYLQVNTSGEPQKSGCKPEEAPQIAKVIVSECKALKFSGVMTIGESEKGEHDFEMLRKSRCEVALALGVDENSLELSCGMSADYELAIKWGSTNVRVGSALFGSRTYPQKH